MDAALTGLIGVALGTVASSGTTVWIEHRRRAHDDRTDQRNYEREAKNRWVRERLPAYKAVIDAANALHEAANAAVLAAALGIVMGEPDLAAQLRDAVGDPNPRQQHYGVVWNRERDLEARISEALLLARDDVAKSLEGLRDDAFKLAEEAGTVIFDPPTEGRPDDLDALTIALRTSVARFAELSRVEIQS